MQIATFTLDVTGVAIATGVADTALTKAQRLKKRMQDPTDIHYLVLLAPPPSGLQDKKPREKCEWTTQ